MNVEKIRNIAILAHVDHGKTTLVDHLLKQAHTFASYQAEMNQTTILDSNDLERERGVTILAKNTAVEWGGYKINILDTPGHADFSGEVERVLNMAEGCLLLVDAAEGVLSQTRYVLSLALEQNLTPIVLINKVDRKDQRVEEVTKEINNLFLDLATHEKHLDFPILYAIGRDGVVGTQISANPDGSLRILDEQNLELLFNTIISKIPAPNVSLETGFQLQVTNLDYDTHKGRCVIGKVVRGQVKEGSPLVLIRDHQVVDKSTVGYIFTFKGLQKQTINKTQLGDIVAITGFGTAQIGDTLASQEKPEGLPPLKIAQPTIRVQIAPSTSPLVGQDGEFVTARNIAQRLHKELETNVGLHLEPSGTGNSFTVSGRGELHLSILIETMRREGFEFSVSRPQVIYKNINGVECEPYESLTIGIPEEYTGIIIETLGQRKATMLNMQTLKSEVRLEYSIPTRSLIGLRSTLLTQTSGLALVHSRFSEYKPKGDDSSLMRDGAIVSSETGNASSHSLARAQHRGATFVDPGEQVYKGMIVGQHVKQNELWMNVCKGKQLTNMRSSTSDIAVKLVPPVKMSLEQCLTFLEPDELLEVTPKNLRLRKFNLQAGR